jgi:hypothetical protein
MDWGDLNPNHQSDFIKIFFFTVLSLALTCRLSARLLKRFSLKLLLLDLSRPCDACGKMIGGAQNAKFTSAFCARQKKLPLEFLMCGGKLG